MLGPTANGSRDLLRIGGGQYEDHVGGRFLEGFEEGVRRRVREHVDLVDDVDLRAPGSPESGVGHQVAHGVDPVVGCRIQLVDVERASLGDLDARGTPAAGFPVAGVGAVERLRQDPRRRCLPRSSRTAEEVGVSDMSVPHSALKRPDDMGLALELSEPGGAEAPIQRKGR